jgi:hypothetical protein
VVLNTLTEHDFQDAFKKLQNNGNDEYTRKGNASKLRWSSGPKLVFDQMAAPILEIMDSSGR